MDTLPIYERIVELEAHLSKIKDEKRFVSAILKECKYLEFDIQDKIEMSYREKVDRDEYEISILKQGIGGLVNGRLRPGQSRSRVAQGTGQ